MINNVFELGKNVITFVLVWSGVNFGLWYYCGLMLNHFNEIVFYTYDYVIFIFYFFTVSRDRQSY